MTTHHTTLTPLMVAALCFDLPYGARLLRHDLPDLAREVVVRFPIPSDPAYVRAFALSPTEFGTPPSVDVPFAVPVRYPDGRACIVCVLTDADWKIVARSFSRPCLMCGGSTTCSVPGLLPAPDLGRGAWREGVVKVPCECRNSRAPGLDLCTRQAAAVRQLVLARDMDDGRDEWVNEDELRSYRGARYRDPRSSKPTGATL